jgi:hypothetical protein
VVTLAKDLVPGSGESRDASASRLCAFSHPRWVEVEQENRTVCAIRQQRIRRHQHNDASEVHHHTQSNENGCGKLFLSRTSTHQFQPRSRCRFVIVLYLLQQKVKADARPNPHAVRSALDKILNGFEAANYNIQGPIYKHVKELEAAIKFQEEEAKKKGKASTLFFLRKYVDQKKFKKK